MAKSRPFAYNPGSQIPGTQKFGNLTVGSHDLTPDQSGVQWWNGPDEDLGYVIAQTNVDGFGNPLQSTPTPGVYAGVGFYQTQGQNDSELIALTNMISGQSFTTASECKTWLEANNRWTSWSDFSAAALSNFKNRVLSSYGTFEAETTLLNQLKQLDEPKFNAASLIITPNAYKEGTLHSVKPTNGSGDLAFARSSVSTRINKDGVLEQVPYNILRYSNDFRNAYWVKESDAIVIVPNATFAPDGTYTASEIYSTSGASSVGTANIMAVPSATYTWSCYVKKSTSNIFTMTAWAEDDPITRFDLGAVSVIYETGPTHTSSIVDVGNGWRRVSITRTISSLSKFVRLRFNTNPLGLTNGGVYMWGAQIVEGTEPRDYLLTLSRNNIPNIDYSTGSNKLLVESQRTNLIYPSETPANQVIAVSANTNYVLSFYGTGTISLSGVYTGSLVGTSSTTRVSLSIPITTAGNLILTISGPVNKAQLETSNQPSSYIPTTTASVTRVKDSYTKTQMYTNGYVTSAGGALIVKLSNNIPRIRTNATGVALNTNNSVVGGNGILITKHSANNTRRLTLRIYQGNTIKFTYTSATDVCIYGVTWNGSTLDAYLNGVKINSTDIVFTNLELQYFWIESPDVTHYDYIQLYPAPLTAEEMITLTTL